MILQVQSPAFASGLMLDLPVPVTSSMTPPPLAGQPSSFSVNAPTVEPGWAMSSTASGGAVQSGVQEFRVFQS